jgi:Na+/H+-dicarboxylate symporter
LVGDCFFIPFVALAILFQFGREIPDIATYLTFSLHFVMAKFAVAAVPGGGILVMLPILQNYLGFNSEMLGLITAIYVLFDSLITGCNVAGNGSLAIIFDKITDKKKL